MSRDHPLKIASARITATMPSWRVLLAAILVASACVSLLPVQRSIGLLTSAHANVSVLSSSNLEAPIGLNATATGPGSISLVWSQSMSTFATGYEVYRITGDEPEYTLITTQIGLASTSYDDGGLTPVTGYTYYIVTIYENWTSAPSPPTIAITPAS